MANTSADKVRKAIAEERDARQRLAEIQPKFLEAVERVDRAMVATNEAIRVWEGDD